MMNRREQAFSCLTDEWKTTHQIMDEMAARYGAVCTITKVYNVLESDRKYRLVEKDITRIKSGNTAIWRLPQ